LARRISRADVQASVDTYRAARTRLPVPRHSGIDLFARHGGVLVEGDSIVWVAQKLRQGVFAVYFEQVEGGYSPSGQRSNSGSRLNS
jgi:hypothetical protein